MNIRLHLRLLLLFGEEILTLFADGIVLILCVMRVKVWIV